MQSLQLNRFLNVFRRVGHYLFVIRIAWILQLDDDRLNKANISVQNSLNVPLEHIR